MKRRVNSRKRRRRARRLKAYFARFVFVLFIALALLLIFSGIKFLFSLFGGSAGSAALSDTESGNLVTVNKDGSITETTVESIDEGSDSEERIKEFLEEEISLYSSSNDRKRTIHVSDIRLKGGYASLKMDYDNPEDYAGFTGKDFSLGEVQKLLRESGGFDVALTSIEDGTVLSHEAEKEIGGHAVILNYDTIIETPGKILYYSRNVKPAGDRQAEVKKANIASIIVYE